MWIRAWAAANGIEEKWPFEAARLYNSEPDSKFLMTSALVGRGYNQVWSSQDQANQLLSDFLPGMGIGERGCKGPICSATATANVGSHQSRVYSNRYTQGRCGAGGGLGDVGTPIDGIEGCSTVGRVRFWTAVAVGAFVCSGCGLGGAPASERALESVQLPSDAVVIAKRTEGIGSTMEFGFLGSLNVSAIRFPEGSTLKPTSPGPSTCEGGSSPPPAGCTAHYVVGASFPNPVDAARHCLVSIIERSDSVEMNGKTYRRAFSVTSCPET